MPNHPPARGDVGCELPCDDGSLRDALFLRNRGPRKPENSEEPGNRKPLPKQEKDLRTRRLPHPEILRDAGRR
jgi:hypothetical protein